MTATSRDANHNFGYYLRFSLWVGALFIASLFICFFYISHSMVTSELDRVDRALDAEVKELQTIYEKGGVKAVDREIILRSASAEGWYILQSHNLLSGNLAFQKVKVSGKELDGISDFEGASLAKVDFTYGANGGATTPDFEQRRGRGLVSALKADGVDSAVVWVARDIEAAMRAADKTKKAFFGSALLALILSLLSGLILSRISRRRDDRNDRVGLAPGT